MGAAADDADASLSFPSPSRLILPPTCCDAYRDYKTVGRKEEKDRRLASHSFQFRPIFLPLFILFLPTKSIYGCQYLLYLPYQTPFIYIERAREC